jgi:hypothetical protein
LTRKRPSANSKANDLWDEIRSLGESSESAAIAAEQTKQQLSKDGLAKQQIDLHMYKLRSKRMESDISRQQELRILEAKNEGLKMTLKIRMVELELLRKLESGGRRGESATRSQTATSYTNNLQSTTLKPDSVALNIPGIESDVGLGIADSWSNSGGGESVDRTVQEEIDDFLGEELAHTLGDKMDDLPGLNPRDSNEPHPPQEHENSGSDPPSLSTRNSNELHSQQDQEYGY